MHTAADPKTPFQLSGPLEPIQSLQGNPAPNIKGPVLFPKPPAPVSLNRPASPEGFGGSRSALQEPLLKGAGLSGSGYMAEGRGCGVGGKP